MSPFVDRIAGLVSSAHSDPEYYQILIDIQKTATPFEVQALLEVARSWPPALADRVGRLSAMMMRNHPTLSPHKRTVINDALTLYAQPGARALVLGFTGHRGLLFMPVAVTLQYFAGGCDLLVLRDPANAGFGHGIAGYAASFPALAASVRRDLELDRYAGVRCFGTSGGGGAALAAGLRLGATSAVSFSGHFTASANHAELRQAPPDIDTIIREGPGDGDRFFGVFGADNKRDLKNAVELEEALELTLWPVEHVSSHNVVFALHTSGNLDEVMRETGLNT